MVVRVNATSEAADVLIDARGLSKVFDGVPVLQDVDLAIRAGEVHALVGANGSGKSTLIKILSGYHQPSAGQVAEVPDPQTGEPPRLTFVHQDLALVDTMSVLENVALSCGYRTGALSRIRWKAMRAEAQQILTEFGIGVRSGTAVGELSGTERRLVAIARATHSLGSSRGVLVLDEPTAALPPDEIHHVFDVMAVVARRGSGVLFVSHNLSETLSVAQTVTVLRNGRRVACVAASDTSVEEVAGYMFGAAEASLAREAQDNQARLKRAQLAGSAAQRPPAMRLSSIAGVRLADISLDVRQGEILGVTGLVGCGKSELGRIMAGIQQPTSGALTIGDGPPVVFKTPGQALANGVAYVPPDRRRYGGILTMQARENVTLSTIDTFFSRGWLRKRRELDSVREQMSDIGAVPRNPTQIFAAFSGGNQQKLVLARVLRLKPAVVILDDPTQGVDVETIPQIYHFLRELADTGCAVVVITADADELVDVTDRVVVLQDGRLIEELADSDVTLEKVGVAMSHGRRGNGRTEGSALSGN